jgi:hypothetical protein
MQTTGLKRDTIDKFYTKQNVAQNCSNIAQQLLNIDNLIDVVIEPSAGNGVFIDSLTKICSNCLFYDIQPEHESIIIQDYLSFDYSNILIPDLNTRYHIIGNPPFGRQSTLAIKFIKYSSQYCDSISFILPKSFKKDSMQRHFPLQFHLIYQCDLEPNSFLINSSEEKDVPCVFQIWKKEKYNRKTVDKIEANGFKFVKKDEDPDISFRRVGVNAGKIDENNLNDKSIQSHYFIKFNDNIDKKDIINKISQIQYTNNNTVGPQSISKQEIIVEINRII